MSSINFNQSALIALDTLKGINKDLTEIQSQISTGKTVDSAKDNAAVWAISKVMESDVSGFMKISETLSMGASTTAVARAATEEIGDLLEEMKGHVIAAQEENQDRQKLQTDINRLTEQINSIIDAAQLNGANLLTGGDDFEVLASLERSSTGLNTSNIVITRYDMNAAQSIDTAAGTYAANSVGTNITLDASQTGQITIDEAEVGKAYSINIATTDAGSNIDDNLDTGGSLADAGDIAYVARPGDTAADIAAGLAAAYAEYVEANGIDTAELNLTADGAALNFESTISDGANSFAIAIDTVVSEDNVGKGAIYDIGNIDVMTNETAGAALQTIERAISDVVDIAAEFGSAEKRVENQMEFVDRLMNAMKAGISALTDTDMEEASARLQALQVQQQLGVQSLSIANSSPQQILSLFRS